MKKRLIRLVFGAVLAASFVPTYALNAGETNGGLNEGWGGEITPYIWAVGIDSELTLRGQKANVDANFSDLAADTEYGGSLLGLLRYNSWVMWNQIDFYKLAPDQVTSPLGNADFTNKSLFYTVAVGRQFATVGRATMDAMIGLRYLYMENRLSVGSLGEKNKLFKNHDAVLVIRPCFPFFKRWAFNPTVSVGGGESRLTYEFQPQLEFKLTDRLVTRFGYRTLFYDIEQDSQDNTTTNEIKTTMTGAIFGLGVYF